MKQGPQLYAFSFACCKRTVDFHDLACPMRMASAMSHSCEGMLLHRRCNCLTVLVEGRSRWRSTEKYYPHLSIACFGLTDSVSNLALTATVFGASALCVHQWTPSTH